MTTQLSFGRTACILLSGKAGVGKTTSANLLKNEFLKKGGTAEIFNFARGIKQMLGMWGWDGSKDAKGREFLQRLGGLGREFDKDCWVRLTLENIVPRGPGYPYDVIIIDDYRFPNESVFVRNNPLYQVFEVRVYSPTREMLRGTGAYSDISETSLPEVNQEGADRYFASIINIGSADDLGIRCSELADTIIDHMVKW